MEHNETIVDTGIVIDDIKVSAYTIPTSSPESDGTIAWNKTTLVLTEIRAGGYTGIGYTYANIAAATIIDSMLKEVVNGMPVMDVPMITTRMVQCIRNEGTCGVAMMAVSAVDNALWDVKAKILELPLCTLLGKATEKMLVYGSGGFTSYTQEQLQQQLSDWVKAGIKHVKIKVGRSPDRDPDRVKQAREVIGDAKLFVDANGACTVKQAVEKAHQFAEHDICWFEEPVSSDDLDGLHYIRNHTPAAIQVAAGEYGYHLPYFKKMLNAGAVDVLQADATRCGGITGFLKAGQLAEAYGVPFSSHCAPSIHLHAALSLPSFYIAEYFYDHTRIEKMLFDGFRTAENGFMTPDESRPGLGIEFKHKDAATYKL
jgi:L-alanine-DL-glutamate epimerase-like enolase superfamily enzyme